MLKFSRYQLAEKSDLVFPGLFDHSRKQGETSEEEGFLHRKHHAKTTQKATRQNTLQSLPL